MSRTEFITIHRERQTLIKSGGTIAAMPRPLFTMPSHLWYNINESEDKGV